MTTPKPAPAAPCLPPPPPRDGPRGARDRPARLDRRVPGGPAPDRRGPRGLPARDGRQPRGLPPRRGGELRQPRRDARRHRRARPRSRSPSPTRPRRSRTRRPRRSTSSPRPSPSRPRRLRPSPRLRRARRPRLRPSLPPAPVAAAPAVDLTASMLSVVALKTGYPQEMIGMEMELEADLGIDSIKRVEILAAMRERAPSLPEMNPSELASLRTIGQIVEHMRARLPGAAAAPARSPLPPRMPPRLRPSPRPQRPAPARASAADLMAMMLAVVALKTGYPEEIIGMEMELEADLGIDSIKRVEILAAVRERTPGLPDLNPAALASLRTVGQIVDYLRSVLPGVASETNLSASSRRPPPRPYAPASRSAATRSAPSPVRPPGSSPPGSSPRVGRRHRRRRRRRPGPRRRPPRARRSPRRSRREVPADADAVIFLGGLRAMATVDEALAVHREAFRAAKRAASPAAPGAFVTVQDTGGDFGLSGAGIARVVGRPPGARQDRRAGVAHGPVPRDRPRSAATATPAALARALADELLAGGTEAEVGLRADGSRLVLESYAEDLRDGAPVLARGDVVVASGGARGVTAATLIALAKETGCRLVLLGRTALEDEPEAARGVTGDGPLKAALMAEAKRHGVAVTPVTLGRQVERVVANREVRATLDAVTPRAARRATSPRTCRTPPRCAPRSTRSRRAWGPIAGVVHGAGVLADKLIADKTEEQFDQGVRHQGRRAPRAARRDRGRPAQGALRVLVGGGALRQPGAVGLRNGQRGAQQGVRRRARAPRPGRGREVPRLGPVGRRHGHPRAGEALPRAGRPPHLARRRRRRARPRAVARAAGDAVERRARRRAPRRGAPRPRERGRPARRGARRRRPLRLHREPRGEGRAGGARGVRHRALRAGRPPAQPRARGEGRPQAPGAQGDPPAALPRGRRRALRHREPHARRQRRHHLRDDAPRRRRHAALQRRGGARREPPRGRAREARRGGRSSPGAA